MEAIAISRSRLTIRSWGATAPRRSTSSHDLAQEASDQAMPMQQPENHQNLPQQPKINRGAVGQRLTMVLLKVTIERKAGPMIVVMSPTTRWWIWSEQRWRHTRRYSPTLIPMPSTSATQPRKYTLLSLEFHVIAGYILDLGSGSGYLGSLGSESSTSRLDPSSIWIQVRVH